MKSSWVKASSCSETDETTVALAPMGTLPVVALWVSNHTQKNLAELRLRYDIPSTIIMRVPMDNEGAVCPEGGEISVFEDVLHAGARFPFSREMQLLLWWFSLSPC